MQMTMLWLSAVGKYPSPSLCFEVVRVNVVHKRTSESTKHDHLAVVHHCRMTIVELHVNIEWLQASELHTPTALLGHHLFAQSHANLAFLIDSCYLKRLFLI